MITHLCINPQAQYCIVWRGDHHGAYFWITPASMRRLARLTTGPLWRQTGIVGGEHWLEVQR
jgi:hypothetical protein